MSNSGEVFGCGAQDNKILDSIVDNRKNDDEKNGKNLEFLPADLQDACKSFLDQNDVLDPMPIEIFTGNSEHRVTHLACGLKHVVAITQKNEAFSWGDNTRGQLGLGNIEERFVGTPRLIKMFETVKLSACGDMHSLLLANSGIVYFFGFNANASEKSKTTIQNTPESIEKISSAIYIAAGANHNAVISKNSDTHSEANHDVYCWGKGWDYQLGKRKRVNLTKPELVEFKGNH